ncbi:MAG: hypothetical protein K9G65_05570 [Rickettsiaceae bacterium]|nr:hypothetical protein [Rickettsiaceae bacterium]
MLLPFPSPPSPCAYFEFTIGKIDKVKDFFADTRKQGQLLQLNTMLRNTVTPNIEKYGGLNVSRSMTDRFKLNTPPSKNYHNSRSENNNLTDIIVTTKIRLTLVSMYQKVLAKIKAE